MQIKSKLLTGQTDIQLTVFETRQIANAAKLMKQIGRNVLPIDKGYEEAAALLEETARAFGKVKKETVKG